MTTDEIPDNPDRDSPRRRKFEGAAKDDRSLNDLPTFLGEEVSRDGGSPRAVEIDSTVKPPDVLDLHDRYDFLNVLQETSSTRLVSAIDRELKRPVLIEILSDDPDVSSATRQSFFAATRTFARINSDLVARVFDSGISSQGSFVVHESVEGDLLSEHRQDDVRDPDRTIRIVGQICEAVAQFHESANAVPLLDAGHVWLTHAGTVKLTAITLTGSGSFESVDLNPALHLGVDLFLPRESESEGGLTESNRLGNLRSLARLIYQVATGVAWSENASAVIPRQFEPIIRKGLRAGRTGGFQTVEDFRSALKDLETETATFSGSLVCLQADCGHANLPDVSFCINCGTRLPVERTPTPKTPPKTPPGNTHGLFRAISPVTGWLLATKEDEKPARITIPMSELLGRITLLAFLMHVFNLNWVATTTAMLAACPFLFGRVPRSFPLNVIGCMSACFLLDYFRATRGNQIGDPTMVTHAAAVARDAVCLLSLLLAFYAYRSCGNTINGLSRLGGHLLDRRFGPTTQPGTAVLHTAIGLLILFSVLDLFFGVTPGTIVLKVQFARLMVWGTTGFLLGHFLEHRTVEPLEAGRTWGFTAGLVATTLLLTKLSGSWEANATVELTTVGSELAAATVHLLVFLLAALIMSGPLEFSWSTMRTEIRWYGALLAICIVVTAVALVGGSPAEPARAMGRGLYRGGLLLVLVMVIRILRLADRSAAIKWPVIFPFSLALLVFSWADPPMIQRFQDPQGQSPAESPDRADSSPDPNRNDRDN